MPVIHVFHHRENDRVTAVLGGICAAVAIALEVPTTRVWAVWHRVERTFVHRPDWDNHEARGPIVRVFCRRSHSTAMTQAMMTALRTELGTALGCPDTSVFVQVIRVDDEDVLNVE